MLYVSDSMNKNTGLNENETDYSKKYFFKSLFLKA